MEMGMTRSGKSQFLGQFLQKKDREDKESLIYLVLFPRASLTLMIVDNRYYSGI